MSADRPIPGLTLDELLDPARVAAAWQTAHVRASADPAPVAIAAATPAPLPLAVVHSRFVDELERTLAEVPGLATRAHPVLAGVRAQLAAALDPLDAAAAEAALDDLEDLVQTLLMTAGWPAPRED